MTYNASVDCRRRVRHLYPARRSGVLSVMDHVPASAPPVVPVVQAEASLDEGVLNLDEKDLVEWMNALDKSSANVELK